MKYFTFLKLSLVVFMILPSETATAQDRPLEIVVHRGANNLAPENTMASTLKCIEMGTDYVEVDIRMSKDGVFYILHDKTLDRTTNGSGLINETLSTDIDKLDAGSWFGAGFKGEKVPRLRPFLERVKGKTKIYFDVKDADLERLIAMVYETGFEKDCFFWFGDDAQAIKFRELDQKLPLKMNASSVAELNKVLAYNPQIIECNVAVMEGKFVKTCKKNKLKLMAYGEDSVEEYQKAIDSPASMINLNKPELMLEMMK
ncbi:MAG: glycerophosphodiester phosphodiesterase family protein [Cyclobacteriaceae bacterium]